MNTYLQNTNIKPLSIRHRNLNKHTRHDPRVNPFCTIKRFDVATLTQHDDHNDSEEDTEEDSLSHTPAAPNPMDAIPQTRPLSLSFVAPIVTINNPQSHKKCDKDDQKHELKKKIELSNSKMVMQQIMNENDNDYIQKMMLSSYKHLNKYIHVLSSYKHLIFEFEPDSASSRPVTPTPTDDSKENEPHVIQNSLTLPQEQEGKKKKKKKGKHGKALSISFGKLRRVKSETGESLKKKFGKKGSKG
eukprot:272984_1